MEQRCIFEFTLRLVNKKNINYAPRSPVKQAKQKIVAFERSPVISAAAEVHEIH